MRTLSTFALALTAATLVASGMASATTNPFRQPGHGPVITKEPAKTPPVYQKFGSNLNITCLVCRLPHPQPQPQPVEPTHGDGDHDGYHRWDRWDRWHSWRDRPEIVVEGRPEAVVVSAPAQGVPARVSVAAPQVAAGPCNCLTKQNMPDGSLLFQDICTKESAVAAPQTVGAR